MLGIANEIRLDNLMFDILYKQTFPLYIIVLSFYV